MVAEALQALKGEEGESCLLQFVYLLQATPVCHLHNFIVHPMIHDITPSSFLPKYFLGTRSLSVVHAGVHSCTEAINSPLPCGQCPMAS